MNPGKYGFAKKRDWILSARQTSQKFKKQFLHEHHLQGEGARAHWA
jgi:hypothetical protein